MTSSPGTNDRHSLPSAPSDLAAAGRRQGGHSEYVWECVTPQAPFAPRDGAGALTFLDRMWLIGGWNPEDKTHFPRICSNDVWSSADGVTWHRERPNTFVTADFDAARDWEGRHTAGYAVFDGALWIVGGDDNQGHYQGDVWRSFDGRTWERMADVPAPWHPRSLHHTLVHDGYIWVLGGQTMPQFAPAPERVYRDIWRTCDGRNWEQVNPRGPCWCARGMIGGSAVLNGRMWILGGGRYDTPAHPERAFYNDVWSSADGIHWTCHTSAAPWAARQYHDVAVFDSRLWVLEGHDGNSNRNDVWYSADGEHWTEVPDTPWAPRHAASVFVFDDALWMVAGNNMVSDVWRLRRRT